MKYKASTQGKDEEEYSKYNKGPIRARLVPSCRLGLTLLLMSGIALMSLLRLILTISLVCMVKRPSSSNQTYPVTPDGTEQTDVETSTLRGSSGLADDLQTTEAYVTGGTHSQQFEGEFEWTSQQQGFLLAAYFYGFCMTQILGGYLSGRFGGKHVFGVATLISTIITLLSPMVARFNLYLFFALRTVLGLASGVLVPTMSTLLGLWAPPFERSFLLSVATAGFTLGVIASALISSQFCLIPIDNGWPLTFYFTGAVSFVFWVFWNIFAFSSPYDHPRISEAELNYIKGSNKLQSNTEIKRRPFSFLKALSSPAVLAIIAAQVSSTWYGHTQSATIPFYLRDVLHFDIRQNGLYTLLPYVLSLLVSPSMGYLADTLQSRKIMSTVTTRKLFQGISNFVGALLVLGVSFIDYDLRYLAVAILIISLSIGNISRAGFLANTQDVAPRYAGEILGISNTAGALTGVLAPIAVGFITPNGSADEWRMVFYIVIAILVVGGLVFVIFAKGEVQPWAQDDTNLLPLNTIAEADANKSLNRDKTAVSMNGKSGNKDYDDDN